MLSPAPIHWNAKLCASYPRSSWSTGCWRPLPSAWIPKAAKVCGRFGWPSGTTFTNEAGWFTLTNLKPNQYYVVFVPALGIRFDAVPIGAGQVTRDVGLWRTGNYAGIGPMAWAA